MEYYAPQGTPFNPSDLCRGEITEIFPSEGLSIITSTHLIIDGLYPITYGRPIRLNREGEWTNTDNCECIVDRQEDGVRRQSGMFKAVVDTAKEAFYTSNESKQLEDFASPSEEEESNDGGFDIFSAGDVVAQTDFGSVIRPCGLKRDGKREAMSQLREKRKRIKADKNDPTYVPESTVPKNGKKKSKMVLPNNTSAAEVSNVSFVFLLFSIIFWNLIYEIVCFLILFVHNIHFIFPIWFHSLIHIERVNYRISRWSCC